MASSPITSWEIDGEKVETVTDFIFLGPKITTDGDCSHEIKRPLLLGRNAMTNLDSILKSRDITLPTKVHLVKAMVFPAAMYGCESWTIKKAECWRVSAFELWCWRTLESPLDCKEVQPVHPKGNQSWILIGRTEAEAPILWSPDGKSQLIGKDPDAGIDWRQREKGAIEDEMVGWHHQLSGHEFEQKWKYSKVFLISIQFSSVTSHLRLSATPWTTACQASLSITNSQSPPKPISIESVMPSNHLILCFPLLLLPPIPPSIRVFSNESALRIKWPKYWSFSFNISPSNEHPGLISFRMDWLDLLAIQGTLKSLLQHHSS